MSSTDLLLIKRWIDSRDAQAFNEIVQRYSALVYGTSRRVLRNDADAEDVTQDCFLHLARTEAPPRRSLGGWLHALATHRALDRLKSKERRRHREASFAASRETAGTSDWEEVQSCVDEAIEALPKDLRALIVAHFLEQRSQESIARELGLSRQTVTYRISKGIEKVRRNLARQGVAVTLASLSSVLSTKLVEAAPARLTASLGKLALAGSSAVGSGTAGTTTTLGILGGIGVMHKITIAAVIAGVLLLLIGLGLSPNDDVPTSQNGDGVGERMAATGAGGALGANLAPEDAAANSPPAPTEPPAAPVDATRTIRGRVVDPDGNVVADAPVAAGGKNGPKLLEVVTDANGVFELEFTEAGGYVVGAFKNGIGLAGQEAATGGEELTLRLEPLGSVSGRIVDKETGDGLDHARIRLNYFGEFPRQDPARAWAFSWLHVKRTRGPERSAGGRYAFVNLLEARYLVELSVKGGGHVVPGLFGEPFLELTVMKGETRTGFDVALARAGAVSGRVFGPNGEPLAGARAQISSSRHSFESRRSVETDDRGAYRFGGLAVGGSYAVIVDHEGLAQGISDAVTLSAPREITGLDVHMSQGHTVSGRIVDEAGDGVPGVTFRLARNQWRYGGTRGREETVTAEDGSFRVERVGPGEYGFVPRAEGFESWSTRRLTMPDHDLEGVEVVLKRKAPGSVAGRVTDAAGKPLEGVRLTIHNDRAGPHVQGSAETDADGRYRFDGIGKAKTFQIGVYTQAYCKEERKQVPLGATDVDFKLEHLAGVLGRVVDDRTGEPVSDFEVRSVSYRNRPGGIPSEHWVPVHSAGGEFVLDDIEAPESAIRIRAKGYAPFVTERIRIEPKETVEMEMRLQKGASIRGRVLDAATGDPLPGVHVRIYAQSYFHHLLLTDRREVLAAGFQELATSDEEGRYEFTGLSPETALNVVAWREGLGTRIVSQIRAPRDQDLLMQPEGRLVVELRRGSEPVKAKEYLVRVSLKSDPTGRRDYWHGIWTTQGGVVEHEGLPPGQFSVLVRTRDRERVGDLSREIRAGETAKLQIDLDRLERRFARLSGMVEVASEWVDLRLATVGEPEKTIDSTYGTTEKPSFRFGGIPPGEYILRARQDKSETWTEQRVTLVAGEELKVEVPHSQDG